MNPPNEAQGYTATYGFDLNGRLYFKNMTFVSRDDYLQWLQRMGEIKDTITYINQNDGPGRSLETNNRLQNWLLLVSNFTAYFGNHKVPLDIRRGVHSVQGHLSIPLTDFGADVGGAFDHPPGTFPRH